MNTKTNAVTGESTVSHEEIEQGTYDELIAKDERRLGLAWPSFEDIQRMAGFPVDSEGYALVVEDERERSDKEQFEREGENDDTRTIGLPSNEEAEADEDSLRDEGRNSDGSGESYAERNA